ncbi:MAG: response regulator transcription factor [Ignavibacteria bacterium]|nr:response regulator transcription factor [Ignavibacteria bacterium]
MKQNQSIRILVADDHTLFRQGVIRLLKDNKKVIVIGEAKNGSELIARYFNLMPDIILVDISMPEVSGIEAVERILEKDPYAKSIFMSMDDGEEYVYKVLKTGGCGLVNKNIMDEELYYAIEKVYRGEKYFGGKWTEGSLNQLLNDYEANHKGNSKFDETKLNFREEQVLNLIVEGMKSKEIADNLNLSKKSIDYYRSTLLRKLEFNTQAELIKFGINYFNIKREKQI